MFETITNTIIATSNALIRRHLEWVYLVTTKKPATVFIACCLVFVLACFSITRIHFEADIFKLFPQKGALALFMDTIEWTGSAGNAYFLLEGNRQELPREAELFAGKLQKLTVDGSPAFRRVKYRIFDPAEAQSFAEFIGYAVTQPQLFVAPPDIARYRELLKPGTVESSLVRAKTELAAPGSFNDIIVADPLYLRELILPRLKTASQALDPFYSLFPVTCGGIAMLGLLSLSGMRLNFMNVMVLVTILGMGSDYGLHIAHRVRNRGDEEHRERFIQSGRAVLLSSLVTIAGFGSLAFTDYGALASIGWATNFGIAATTLFTLVTLPAFMRLFINKSQE